MSNHTIFPSSIIGKNIQNILQFKHMKPSDLGKIVNCSEGHIKNIVSGASGISVDMLVKIANALDVSTDVILNGLLTVNDKYYDNEINDIFRNCDVKERDLLISVLKSVKASLSEYNSDTT